MGTELAFAKSVYRLLYFILLFDHIKRFWFVFLWLYSFIKKYKHDIMTRVHAKHDRFYRVELQMYRSYIQKIVFNKSNQLCIKNRDIG